MHDPFAFCRIVSKHRKPSPFWTGTFSCLRAIFRTNHLYVQILRTRCALSEMPHTIKCFQRAGFCSRKGPQCVFALARSGCRGPSAEKNSPSCPHGAKRVLFLDAQGIGMLHESQTRSGFLPGCRYLRSLIPRGNIFLEVPIKSELIAQEYSVVTTYSSCRGFSGAVHPPYPSAFHRRRCNG